MIPKETIFSFFETKYPNEFIVFPHTENEGITAMVFDLKHNDEFVARVIKYHELPDHYTVCSKELLSQTQEWFGISSYKCECFFDEWLKNSKLVSIT